MTIALTLLGIIAPSLVLVAALRRWIAPVPWSIVWLFIALTLAFQHGAVFTSQLPVPVDEVARGYPGRGVFGPVQPRNALTNDTVKLFLPWMHVVREELVAGRFPLWNRYAFSGYPLLANGESAPFSPFFLATLFVPLPKQIVAMAGLKIFVALLFGFLFLKREGVSNGAAAFGASIFAFSVFQTVFLYYSTTAVTALLPAALCALCRCIDVPRPSSVIFLALVIGALMANGHPESVLHIAMGAFVVLLIDFGFAKQKREWILGFRFALIGVAAGLALSAPAWVPVLEQVFVSTRYADLAGGRDFGRLPPTALWAIVSPNGFGNPLRGNWAWISNYSSVASSYVGLVTLACVVAAMFDRRASWKVRCWILAAAFLFIVAMEWGPTGQFLNQLPPFSITANDKLRFVACFLAAMVAAKTIDSRPRPLLLLIGALAVALPALYVYRVRPTLLRPVDLSGVAAVFVIAATALTTRFRPTLPWVALTASLIELFALNAPFNALVDGRYYKPRLLIVEALKQRAPSEPFRIAGFDWMMMPNEAALYGLEDVRGSDPMALSSYTSYLAQIAVDDPRFDVDRVTNVEDPAIDFLNVRFLLAEPGSMFGGRWRRVYRGPDGDLYENDRARPRFFSPSAVVEVLRSSPTDFALRITAREDTQVLSSQPFAPGWTARLGTSVPIELVQGAFIGFRVPRGLHTAELRYRPRSFYASLAFSAVTAGILTLWACYAGSRRRGTLLELTR